MRFNAARILHLRDVLVIRLKGDGKDRERSRLILHLDLPFIDPHGNFFPCSPILPKESPVPESNRRVSVQISRKAGRIQDTLKHRLGIGPTEHATQHVIWTVPSILSG